MLNDRREERFVESDCDRLDPVMDSGRGHLHCPATQFIAALVPRIVEHSNEGSDLVNRFGPSCFWRIYFPEETILHALVPFSS
jgi:hypothetical protein